MYKWVNYSIVNIVISSTTLFNNQYSPYTDNSILSDFVLNPMCFCRVISVDSDSTCNVKIILLEMLTT